MNEFRKATEYLDDKQIDDDMEVPIDRFLLPKDLQAMLEQRVKTFNNMAQAQMKLTAWDSAIASIRQVVKRCKTLPISNQFSTPIFLSLMPTVVKVCSISYANFSEIEIFFLFF